MRAIAFFLLGVLLQAAVLALAWWSRRWLERRAREQARRRGGVPKADWRNLAFWLDAGVRVN